MPFTSSSASFPSDDVTFTGLPTLRSWSSANSFDTIAPSTPRPARTACESSIPSNVYESGDRVRVDAGQVAAVAVDLRQLGADRADVLGLGRLGDRVAGAGHERAEAVRRRDDEVRLHLILDRAAVRRLHAVREDGDEGDERDADHERRGGRGRALRVPHRVALGQAARGAADLRRGPADDRGERPDEVAATSSRPRRTAGARRRRSRGAAGRWPCSSLKSDSRAGRPRAR